jgi:pyruvate formate lyase activating enzyme
MFHSDTTQQHERQASLSGLPAGPWTEILPDLPLKPEITRTEIFPQAPDKPEQPVLQVGGLVPLSTGDYPDCLSAIVFCQGCPWRCRYCHNPHLQSRDRKAGDFGEVMRFLQTRIGLLDAVVFSGGEPTYQAGIFEAASAVRKLGFKIGLHTAAPRLERFKKLMPLLDWVGLDIKALKEDYAAVTGIAGSAESPFQTLSLLLDSGIEFEVRTTMHPLLINEEKLLKLTGMLARLGVRNYALQVFRQNGCLDEELKQLPATPGPELIKELSSRFENFSLRDY